MKGAAFPWRKARPSIMWRCIWGDFCHMRWFLSHRRVSSGRMVVNCHLRLLFLPLFMYLSYPGRRIEWPHLDYLYFAATASFSFQALIFIRKAVSGAASWFICICGHYFFRFSCTCLYPEGCFRGRILTNLHLRPLLLPLFRYLSLFERHFQ